MAEIKTRDDGDERDANEASNFNEEMDKERMRLTSEYWG